VGVVVRQGGWNGRRVVGLMGWLCRDPKIRLSAKLFFSKIH
jgi:hypothetical protein